MPTPAVGPSRPRRPLKEHRGERSREHPESPGVRISTADLMRLYPLGIKLRLRRRRRQWAPSLKGSNTAAQGNALGCRIEARWA